VALYTDIRFPGALVVPDPAPSNILTHLSGYTRAVITCSCLKFAASREAYNLEFIQLSNEPGIVIFRASPKGLNFGSVPQHMALLGKGYSCTVKMTCGPSTTGLVTGEATWTSGAGQQPPFSPLPGQQQQGAAESSSMAAAATAGLGGAAQPSVAPADADDDTAAEAATAMSAAVDAAVADASAMSALQDVGISAAATATSSSSSLHEASTSTPQTTYSFHMSHI
jgi:hypothetical protein